MKAHKVMIAAAAGVFGVAAFAIAGTGSMLDTFVKNLHAAEGLDVSFTMTEVGGGSADYRVVLAKPNKFRIDGPSQLVVADGKTVTVYMKKERAFYKKAQTDRDLLTYFNDQALATWSPFFSDQVFAGIASAKDAGEKVRKGVSYKVVNAVADAKGETTMVFYLDPKDAIARQAEFTVKAAGKTSTKIMNTSSLTLTASENLFAFNPPAGSKEINEADLVVNKWYYNIDEAAKIAAATNRPMMVDFMASWCGPCKMMDAEVFQSARFKDVAKDFVLVKIDVDEQKSVAQRYGISAMPTVKFVRPSGDAFHEFVGYGGPEQVFGEMAKAKAMFRP